MHILISIEIYVHFYCDYVMTIDRVRNARVMYQCLMHFSMVSCSLYYYGANNRQCSSCCRNIMEKRILVGSEKIQICICMKLALAVWLEAGTMDANKLCLRIAIMDAFRSIINTAILPTNDHFYEKHLQIMLQNFEQNNNMDFTRKLQHESTMSGQKIKLSTIEYVTTLLFLAINQHFSFIPPYYMFCFIFPILFLSLSLYSILNLLFIN